MGVNQTDKNPLYEGLARTVHGLIYVLNFFLFLEKEDSNKFFKHICETVEKPCFAKGLYAILR